MKTILKTVIVMLFLITITPICVFANTLTLKVTTNKSKYEVGEDIFVTVDWAENMQAACFKLKYDSDILEFKSASIANIFYNMKTAGEISVNWASMEEKDLTQMTFKFTAIETGSAKIYIDEVESFADENMVSPTDYNLSSDGRINISINTKISSENTSEKKNNTQNTFKSEKTTDSIIKAYSLKNEESKESSKLPNTGKKPLLITIIIIAIIGGIGYIKYKRLSGV